MNIKLFFLVLFSVMLTSCGVGRNAGIADNDISICDTCSFETIASDTWWGVMVKNNARENIKSITVYADNTAPFYVELKSVCNSEPNRIYRDNSVENISGEAILCKPESRGFYTVKLAGNGVSVRGDIFIMFRSASAEGETPRLAVCKQKPNSRFMAVSSDNKGISYSDVEGFDIIPLFVSIGFK